MGAFKRVPLLIQQPVDDDTIGRVAAAAFRRHAFKRFLKFEKIRHFAFDQRYIRKCHAFHIIAGIGAVHHLQEACYFPIGKAQLAGPADERQPLQMIRGIASIARGRARRVGHQADLFVKADGLQVHARLFSNRTSRKITFLRSSHFVLEPVIITGCSLAQKVEHVQVRSTASDR